MQLALKKIKPKKKIESFVENKQPKVLYPASLDKRFFAGIIDFTLAGILIQTFAIFFNIFAIELIIYFVYQILFLSIFGWSPGKKMMGLHVVNIYTLQKPTPMNVVAREIIGRVLSSFLLIGYLMILITDVHEGLHDRISKTRVVSFDKTKALPVQVLVGGIVLIMALIFGTIYHSLMYTTTPLKLAVHYLKPYGVHAENIKGNLKKGFNVTGLEYSTPKVNIYIDKFEVSYDRLFSKPLLIRKLLINDMKIKLLSETGESFFVNQSVKTIHKNIEEWFKYSIHFDQVVLKNISIEKKDDVVAFFSQAHLDHFNLNERELKFNRFWVDSQYIQFDFNNLILNKEDIQIGKSFLILKKILNPDIIKADIDFNFNGKMDPVTKIFTIRSKGFKKTVTLNVEDLKYAYLTFENFQPHWFFNKLPPIHTVQIKYYGPLKDLLSLNNARFSGRFFIRKKELEIENFYNKGRFFETNFQNGSDLYKLSFSFSNFKKNESLLKAYLTTAKNENLKGAISKLYFSKSLKSLSAVDAQIVYGDESYYQVDYPLRSRNPADYSVSQPTTRPPSK